MANPFVHVELGTIDVAKAKSFYQSLFNWQLNDVEMGGGMTYTLIGVGEGTGGGMMKHPVPGAPSAWLPYVQVDDLVAATAKAKSLGATVMRDVTRSWTRARFRSSSIQPAPHWGFGSKRQNDGWRCFLSCRAGPTVNELISASHPIHRSRGSGNLVV